MSVEPTALAGDYRALRINVGHALAALAEGSSRGSSTPLTPQGQAREAMSHISPVIPESGVGSATAIRDLVRFIAAGAVDPNNPRSIGHLHCPPLAVAAAADLAATALNPSMDSWDQAPSSIVLEELVTAKIAAMVYPDSGTGAAELPDALVTSGGTESNLVAALITRELARRNGTHSPLQVIVGANAHHSVQRASWLLGLPPAIVVPTPSGRLEVAAVSKVLSEVRGSNGHSTPLLLVATAGTTDTGKIDPIRSLCELARRHGARFHVDAAYGGALLFSAVHRDSITDIRSADTVSLDFHKLGWQPIAAGMLAVRSKSDVNVLDVQADYLNAYDDTVAGMPDVLGRSIRTSRRPDIVKLAATFRALGRTGMGDLVDRCVKSANELAAAFSVDQRLQVQLPPGISTVLFRPVLAGGEPMDDGVVAAIRRDLLLEHSAVLGRALSRDTDGVDRLWLKLSVLHPDLPNNHASVLADAVVAAAQRHLERSTA